MGHDVHVDPEMGLNLAARPLVWAARKAAGKALEQDELLLGIESGNLRRFRDNGADRPLPPTKLWARAIPAARSAVIVTYTRRQMLFLGDGLAVNCPIVSVHRAELVEREHQVLPSGTGTVSSLSRSSTRVAGPALNEKTSFAG